MSRSGGFRHVLSRLVVAGQGSCGWVRFGKVRCGVFGLGKVSQGKAVMVRFGTVSLDVLSYGQARLVGVRQMRRG